MARRSFKKRATEPRAPADDKTTFDVFVAVRHTRSGDHRIGVYNTADVAMDVAERAADSAARDYGYGSASAFPARLEYTGPAIQEKKR